MTTTFPTLTPVECTTWCADGDGHIDAEAPEEQFCRSVRRTVEVAAAPDGAGGSWCSRLFVHLYRDAEGRERSGATSWERPRVELVGNDSDPLSLSLDEARELGELLVELAATGSDDRRAALRR